MSRFHMTRRGLRPAGTPPAPRPRRVRRVGVTAAGALLALTAVTAATPASARGPVLLRGILHGTADSRTAGVRRAGGRVSRPRAGASRVGTSRPGAAAAARRVPQAVRAASDPVVTVVTPLYRDPARCALDCGELVQTYTTPSYTSLDVPRSLTLVYRSGRARPRPVVEVDVEQAAGGPTPAMIGLKLLYSNGSLVTLNPGLTEVVRRYAPGAPNRLAAQVNIGGVNTLTAVVTAYDAAGSSIGQTTQPATVLVDGINGAASPYGVGWGIAGLQRWGNQAEGAVIVDGDGSIGLWRVASTSGTVTQYVSPPGDFTQVAWDASAGLLTRRYPDGTVVRFDGSGAMLSSTDRLGQATTFAYADAAKVRLSAVIDPAGYTISLGYWGPGVVWREGALGGISDNLGRSVAIGVDAANDLRVVNEPQGASNANRAETHRYAYNGEHQLTQGQDARGGVWDYTYSYSGELQTAAAPAIAAAGGGTARPTTVLGWQAHMMLGYWPAGQGTLANPGSAVHSAAPVVQATDPAGLTTHYVLDRWGAATWVGDPSGAVATAERDGQGNLVRAVGPNGHEARAYWNPAKPYLVDSTWDVTTGRRVRYTYDAANADAPATVRGDVPSVTNTWVGGRVQSTQVGDNGPVTRYYYGASGDTRPDSVVDQNGHATRAYLGQAGLRNTDSVRTTGGTTRIRYDAFGRPVTVVNATGDSTRTEYDLLNRVTATTDALGHRTATVLNDPGGTATVTDPVGQTYADTTNALGLPVARTDPAGRVTRTVYDSAGRVSDVINRRGQSYTFRYHPQLGHLSDLWTPDGSNATYGADPAGRFAAGENAERADTTFFDAAGRPSKAVTVIKALSNARIELQYGYDAQGRRTEVRLSDAGRWSGLNVRYTYNARGQLDTLVDFARQATTFGYDAEGSLTRTTLPGLGTESEGPTALHLPGGQRFTNGTLDNAFGTRLGRDALGRVTERISPSSEQGQGYGFDRIGRLTSLSAVSYGQDPAHGCTPVYGGSGVAPTTPDEQPSGYICPQGGRSETPVATYDWDAVGNPIGSAVAVAPNSGNRLERLGDQELRYDPDGNLVQRVRNGVVVQNLEWNSLGQLIRAATNDRANGIVDNWVTFGYDAAGRRVRKTTNDGRTTYYVWDGDDLAAEFDAGGNLLAAFTYLPGVDQLHSVYAAPPGRPIIEGQVFYYLQDDAPGSVRGLVASGGTVVATYDVDVWGRPTAVSEPGLYNWAQPFLFAGREYDRETGLYYNRARYYDPGLRRFISEDPIGLAGGINLYAYAGNDPVNYTDPSGTDCTAAEAEKVTYSQDEDGNWTETRTCPKGSGGGGATTFGRGFNPLGGLGGNNPFGTSANFGNPNARGGCSGLCGSEAAAALTGAGQLLRPAEPVLQGIAAAELAFMGGGAFAARSGLAVIGNFPRYLDVGRALGASRFTVGDAFYRIAGPQIVTPLNVAFMRANILMGNSFLIALRGDAYLSSVNRIGPGLQMELDLLASAGYRQMGRWFVP